MSTLLLGILFVAAVATAGDYAWYETPLDPHRWTDKPAGIAIAGVIHGALLLTAVGAVLGKTAGRLAAGLPIGAVSGVFGALVYYAITTVAGRRYALVAMVLAWAALWLMMAFLNGHKLAEPRHSTGEVLGRGLAAAILGGCAFYLMVSTLWGRPPATGRNYALQFAAWAIAWAPGILAVGWPRKRT
jgi:hypothetical protein